MSLAAENPENLILLSCARTNMEQDAINEVKELLKNNLDWDYITSKSLQMRTSQLLYKNLEKIDTDKVIPERILKNLKKLYYIAIAQNMFFYDELSKVLNVFKDEGIDVIILKGGALEESVYGDIGLRSFNDIDILVRKNDLQKAKNTIKAAGYTLDNIGSPEANSEKFGYNLHYIKDIILEIHWDITRRTGNEKYAKIEINELWKNAISAKIANVETKIMAPEDFLMHSCIHMAGHYYSRLIWFCDISEVIRKYYVNWDSLVKNAKKSQVTAYMFYGLYFTDQLLDCGVPAFVLDELKPHRFEKKVFDSIPSDLLQDKINILQFNPLLKMLLIDRKLDRLRFLGKYFFPPAGVLSRNYSVSGTKLYFYYILHPLFLGFKSAIRIFQLVVLK